MKNTFHGLVALLALALPPATSWAQDEEGPWSGKLAAGYLAGKHIPLFHPRKDRWADHFRWNGPLLVGKSDIARVTIDVLLINRPDRLEVRQALIEEGVFPPGLAEPT